jgi:hypothetical protein
MNKEIVKSYNGPFCCFELDTMINEGEDPLYNVNYNAKIREYSLKSLEGPYICNFAYCPWCGKHFQRSLRDEWFYIIRSEYGLNPWMQDEYEKIPAEFLSDEWWKKRGL